MLIELWRKVLKDDHTNTYCSVCGNDFDRGNVFPVALGDHGDELGEMCSVCLDYLNRRKEDQDDPTLGNWPSHDWPSLEDLEEARRLYPEPMFVDRGEFEVAAPDFETQDEIYAASVVYRMEPETNSAR